jgi:hypothetical protein
MYLLSNVVDMIIVASSAGFVKHSTKKGEKMVGLGNEIDGWPGCALFSAFYRLLDTAGF